MRTKLPKKWCVAVTKENKDIFTGWRTAGGALDVTYGYITNASETHLGMWYQTPQGEEITTEEFKHLVLKQKLPKENYKYLTTFLRKLNIT